MDIHRKRNKVMTLIGANLILLTNGLFLYWGNMAPYVLSYMAMTLSSYSDLESPWTISLNLSSLAGGMFVYSVIATVIGGHWTAVLGILATDIGILASYLAVKSSFFALNITLGIVMGLGTGLTQGYVMDVVVQWSNGDVGTLISLSHLLYYSGPVLVNQLMTAYTNPDNLVPNLKVGAFDYYTQVEIIDKVPYSFLVLGCLSIPCHIIGILMIRSNKFEDNPAKDRDIQKNRSSKDNSIPDTRESYGTNSSPETQLSLKNNLVSASPQTKQEAIANDIETQLSLKENFATASSETKQEGVDNGAETSSAKDTIATNSNSDYTPTQVLRSVAFYAMWTSFFLSEYPAIVVPNYYKLFGQVWIHDDHFLTILGSSMALVTVLTRVAWGVAIDRFGVTRCLVVGLGMSVIQTCWYFFTPMAGKWLYFLVTNVLVATSSVLFASYVNTALLLFGKTHFPTNFGLIMISSALVLNLTAPMFIEYILQAFGWFYLFATAAISCFLSLVLVLIFLPYDGDVHSKDH